MLIGDPFLAVIQIKPKIWVFNPLSSRMVLQCNLMNYFGLQIDFLAGWGVWFAMCSKKCTNQSVICRLLCAIVFKMFVQSLRHAFNDRNPWISARMSLLPLYKNCTHGFTTFQSKMFRKQSTDDKNLSYCSRPHRSDEQNCQLDDALNVILDLHYEQ